MTLTARTRRARKRGRITRLLLGPFCAIAVAAGCAFVLQRSSFLDWANRLPSEVALSPLDVAFITVIITCVWSLIGRLSWALALVSGAALIIAGINRNKIDLRGEPLFPADRSYVSQPGFFVSMVDQSAVVGLLGAVVVVVVTTLAAGRILSRRYPPPRIKAANGGLNTRLLVVRGLMFGLSAALLIHATQFNRPGNLWRALYDADAEWQPWSQVHNYRSNGFVGGLLYNMPVDPMDRPDGYDAEAMARLSERYAERAALLNAGRTGSLTDADVVFVLSESFTDPAWLNGIDLAENPIPAAQQVMSETLAGRMYAHSYGGGTATVEFESLTGQPVGLFRPQVTSPFPMFVSDHATYPSAVSHFSSLGHRTVAIHAYHLDMYKRAGAYRALGFDEVIDRTAMQSRHRIEKSRFISDAAAFDEVLHQLERHDGPSFVNLVTMQNHGPHHNSYGDPIDSAIADPTKATEFGHYARGLAHSDAALTNFLDTLQARDRKTIVVFYGDHHPGIYNDSIVANNDQDALARTPFFVWNSEANDAQHVQAVGAAMFLPMVYEAADAPMPPFVALLDEVRRSVPVLQHARTLDADGRPVDLNDLDEPTAALIDDLRLVQYDFSMGRRHAVDAMWRAIETEAD